MCSAPGVADVGVHDVTRATAWAGRAVVAGDPFLVERLLVLRERAQARAPAPSVHRPFTSMLVGSTPPLIPRVTASHTRCTASYAIDGSLARPTPGRRPDRHVRPASSDDAQPMRPAPPSSKRPTWNVATTVDPKEKLSGSAMLACWAPATRVVSRAIRRATVSQSARTTSSRSTFTMSTPRPQITVCRTPLTALMRSFRAVPRIVAAAAVPIRVSATRRTAATRTIAW